MCLHQMSELTTATVLAIIRRLVAELRELIPSLVCIHYVTDLPSSQYRNKYMMHVVAFHEEEIGVKAAWHYLEAGHGKGPCDGVGGTSKRMADAAVTQGKQ